MATTFGQLASALGRQASRVEIALHLFVNDLGLRLHRGLVTSTPVDEGWARSNWLPSTGVPVTIFRQPYAIGKHLGISETANAAGAIRQGEGIIATRGPGEVLYIQNSTPYIGELNNGSSRQAPKLFVEREIARAVNDSRGFVI